MSLDDQIRWDRQYLGSDGREEPAAFLKEILEAGHWDIAPGRALDIACGTGRNALFLAEKGFTVSAVDISRVGLALGARRAKERSLSISWQQADLESFQLPHAAYDLIMNINFLQRSLIPQIKSALIIGGHVIFETYLIDQQAIGHPKNPNYLLARNELLEHFRDFHVLYYREGKFADGDELAFRAGIFAQKLG
ncbi:MAG TPA: class I SAM-dependent methyltransferase [Candidatus Binatia bacterium]|jgi:SAM-dependent methyltransferase